MVECTVKRTARHGALARRDRSLRSHSQSRSSKHSKYGHHSYIQYSPAVFISLLSCAFISVTSRVFAHMGFEKSYRVVDYYTGGVTGGRRRRFLTPPACRSLAVSDRLAKRFTKHFPPVYGARAPRRLPAQTPSLCARERRGGPQSTLSTKALRRRNSGNIAKL